MKPIMLKYTRNICAVGRYKSQFCRLVECSFRLRHNLHLINRNKMKRKDFLKQSALAGLTTFALFANAKAIKQDKNNTPTPDETEGPFPTHEPGKYVAKNIIADRVGTPLSIQISVFNLNSKCEGLKNAIVDIWQCDSQGEYSEYGGKDEHGGGQHPDRGFGAMPPPGGMPPNFQNSDSLYKRDGQKMPPPGGPPPNFQNHDTLNNRNGQNMPPPMMFGGGSMQEADHVKEHFLRGRQTANKKGKVAFTSIYPGWYPGRAPHIHVHIYDEKGKSLLVTQIAFPEEISKQVYSQGVYKNHGLPETSNANDNVFNDSIANELGVLTGNLKEGFVLQHSIYVKA